MGLPDNSEESSNNLVSDLTKSLGKRTNFWRRYAMAGAGAMDL